MANKKRVMIVDDDPDIRLSVKQILENSGYKVYSFENGRECMRALNESKKRPSLIILDIMMPEMSGWEIHRQLDSNPNLCEIPIVFLTGRTNETAKEMYNRYGTEYIKKPFNIKDFKDCINRIIKSKNKDIFNREKMNYCS